MKEISLSGFFGTSAVLITDINLLIQIISFLVLLISLFYKFKAKIKIPKFIERLKKKYLILGDKSKSKYFPINNAWEMLLSLTFIGKRPTLKNCLHCKKIYEKRKEKGKGLYSGIPAHLQRIRQLTPSSSAIIEKFANSVNSGQIVFISYRRDEAKDRAFSLVKSLGKNNFSSWYDHGMIPKSVAKK